MHLILSRVHWGWCVFPLHNQSLTQTLVDHRFLVTIILSNDSWILIIILWLNPKNLPNTQHLTPGGTTKSLHRCQTMSRPPQQPWSTSKYACNSRKRWMKVKDSEKLYPEVIAKYKEQLSVYSSRRSNKLTNNMNNICNIWMSNGEIYQKIVRYKVGSFKGKPSEEEYLALTSIRVSIVFLSVSLARSRISATYFDWERR